ncbi:MAG: ABC transporter substrate-binding protein [Terriglobales bacterium]
MRLTAFPWLVASSLLCAMGASAAARPHYGGTLQVEMRAAPRSLDPADSSQADWFGFQNLSSLMFETLVSLGQQGKPEPVLASSWQAEPGNQRWQFFLRRGITFQDGTPLTAEAVAASLRRTNPTWKVLAEGEAVIIERDSAAPNLLAELSLPRNSIVKRDAEKISGTGPFVVSAWDPGKKLSLAAREDYWGGRAFLDAIEIEMGKSFREQMIAFDLGKAQVIEVAPDQARRAGAEGRHVDSSAPMELIALVFNRDSESPDAARQRRALALSIDRESLNTVVLQGGGEPAGGLLPNWMTGYAFLFPSSVDLELARQVRSEIPHTTSWSLGYDAADPTARLIAERIVLNARDAGLRMQITGASGADLRVVRIPLISVNAQIALVGVVAGLGLSPPELVSASLDDLYNAENRFLQSQRLIPLLHLRTAYAVAHSVKNWRTARDGSWRLSNVWLGPEKP